MIKNHPLRTFVYIFLTILFFSCETGSDPDSTLPLAGPRSIQVTARDRELVLQWTKVAPAQGKIPDYQVYYGENSDPTSALTQQLPLITPGSSNLVQGTITGLTNHTTYYIWVKAIYPGLGESDFSPITFGIPIPPPAPPGPLTVYPGEEMLEVTWDGVDDAFTYEVYYQASGSGNTPPTETAMLTVSEPGVVVSSLANGTSYTVWVRARNTAGDSPAYSQSTGAPVAATSVPSSPPGKLTVTPGDGKLTISWAQVPGVPGYKLYYGTSSTFSGETEFQQTIPASSPTVRAEITGLKNDTLYYVRVKSWNSQGVSASYSQSASGKPLPKDPIIFTNLQFKLGEAAAEYIFAQDLPASVFFPEGRPNTDRLTRVQETALGNLFTDGAAWYIRKNYPEENIDFVFLNGGYIDNVLPKGTITVGGLSSIVKPDSRSDKFMLLTLTGADLKQFFNDVADVVHTGRGSSGTGEFGIVSKEVRYTLQYYKPPTGTTEISYEAAEPYYHGFIKTETLKINGEAIVDNKDYRICTTNYVASGVYFTILVEKGKSPRLINTPFWHGVAEYIYDQGTVTPALDGRIKVEGGVPLPPPWVPGSLIKP